MFKQPLHLVGIPSETFDMDQEPGPETAMPLPTPVTPTGLGPTITLVTPTSTSQAPQFPFPNSTIPIAQVQLGQKISFPLEKSGEDSLNTKAASAVVYVPTSPFLDASTSIQGWTSGTFDDDDDDILEDHALLAVRIAKQQYGIEPPPEVDLDGNPHPHDPAACNEAAGGAGRVFDDVFVPSIPDASDEANANLVKALEQGAAKYQGEEETRTGLDLDQGAQRYVESLASSSSHNVEAPSWGASSSGGGSHRFGSTLDTFSDDGDAWSRATERSRTPTDFSVEDREHLQDDDDMDADMEYEAEEGETSDDEMGFGLFDGGSPIAEDTKVAPPHFDPVSPRYSPTSPSYSPTSPNHSPISPNFSPTSPKKPPPCIPKEQPYTRARPSSEIFQPVDPYNPGFFEIENNHGSYFAAEFTDIQGLDRTKSLVVLRFNCHPQRGYRFVNAVVRWKVFAPPQSGDGVRLSEGRPKILYHAPRQSYGSATKEQHSTHWSVQFPLQAGAGPFSTVGITPELGHQIDREVSHSMVIIGSVRRERSEGVWTLGENTSARSGIPTEFQLAMVVGHEGPFVTEIVTSASVKAESVFAMYPMGKTLKSKHRCVRWVDVERWKKGKEQEREDLEAQIKVKEMMDKMTGEVGGALVRFAQMIPRP